MRALVGFLRSPNVILTRILRVYNIFVAPWLHPPLEGYIKLWGFFLQVRIRLFHHITCHLHQSHGSTMFLTTREQSNGPIRGGSLLYTTIGSIISLVASPVSSASFFSCFLGVKVANKPVSSIHFINNFSYIYKSPHSKRKRKIKK